MRWARPHKAAITVAVLALCAVATLAVLSIGRVIRARDEARQQSGIAVARSLELERERKRADERNEALVLAQATRLLKEDAVLSIGLLGENINVLTDTAALRRMALRALHNGLPDHVLHYDAPGLIALSPAGNLLAIHDQTGLAIWSMEDFNLVGKWPGSLSRRPERDLEWIDSEHVISVSAEDDVWVTNVESRAQRKVATDCVLAALSVAPSVGRAAFACSSGEIYTYDVVGGTLRPLDSRIQGAAAISLAGGRLLVGDQSGTLTSLLLPTGRVEASRSLGQTGLTALAVQPGLALAIVGSQDGGLILVNIADLRGRPLRTHAGAAVFQLAWVEQRRFASAAADGRVLLVDIEADLALERYDADGFRVVDGFLILGDNRGSLRLQSTNYPWSRTIKAHATEVSWIAAAAGGAFATASDQDQTIRIRSRLPVPSAFIRYQGTSVRIAADSGSNGIVFASNIGDVRFCHPHACTPFPLPINGDAFLRWSRNGEVIAISPLRTTTLYLWHPRDGSYSTNDLPAEAVDVRVLRDRVAVTTADGGLHVFEFNGTTSKFRTSQACSWVSQLRWTHEQKILVACEGGSIDTLDPATGVWTSMPVAAAYGHPSGAVLLRDGRLVVSTSSGTVLSYDPGGVGGVAKLADCGSTIRLFAQSSDLYASAFPCNGELLFVGDGEAVVYNADVTGPIRHIDVLASSGQVAIAGEGMSLLWGSVDGSVRPILDDASGDEIALSSDGDAIYIATQPGLIERWQSADLPELPLADARLKSWIHGRAAEFSAVRPLIAVDETR